MAETTGLSESPHKLLIEQNIEFVIPLAFDNV